MDQYADTTPAPTGFREANEQDEEGAVLPLPLLSMDSFGASSVIPTAAQGLEGAVASVLGAAFLPEANRASMSVSPVVDSGRKRARNVPPPVLASDSDPSTAPSMTATSAPSYDAFQCLSGYATPPEVSWHPDDAMQELHTESKGRRQQSTTKRQASFASCNMAAQPVNGYDSPPVASWHLGNGMQKLRIEEKQMNLEPATKRQRLDSNSVADSQASDLLRKLLTATGRILADSTHSPCPGGSEVRPGVSPDLEDLHELLVDIVTICTRNGQPGA